MELLEVKKFFLELLSLLDSYGNQEIKYQLNEIRRAIYIIESSADENEIKKIIHNIYPPRGGLSDFYVWDDEENKRIEINTKISYLSDQLWNYTK